MLRPKLCPHVSNLRVLLAYSRVFLTYFYAHSQNSFEKRQLALSCLPVCRRGTARLSWVPVFSLSSILWNFSKTSWPKFWLKSDRNNEIIYMKTYVHWWQYAPFTRSIQKRQQIQRGQRNRRRSTPNVAPHRCDFHAWQLGTHAKNIAVIFNMYSSYPERGNGRHRVIINMHNITNETLFIY
jgi:hypothetical protein